MTPDDRISWWQIAESLLAGIAAGIGFVLVLSTILVYLWAVVG